ncbi:MAG TPA: hypothetical protein VKU87_08820, partial [Thermomicrobiaceae bacterium]|nr:hypothetical protein [Thermomicrobiaceae bacterium]
MRKRFLNVAIALGMVIGLLAAAIGSAGAATTAPTQGDAVNWIFFPWVPNGETVAGTGPWYGSATIQNTEDAPVNIYFGLTTGGIMLPQTATIQPHAAYTFTAADLFGT